MTQMIFVNLPVADVERSAAFYEAVGFGRDPRFSQPGSIAAMTLSDGVVFMLASPERFAELTPRPIGDPRTAAQVLISVSRDSRAAVDVMVDAAVAAGGRADLGGVHDQGGHMYGRDFEDPDGHGLGVMWMDVEAALNAWAEAPAATA